MSCLPWPSEEKFLERVLRDCEDELAFSLCRVDPVELCEKFFERSVISRESYSQFTSMDHNSIKSQLQLRYLVRLVSEKVKKDPALWENLIAVLDTLEGVPSSLTDKLKQAVWNANERLADDSEEVGGVSGASLGEAVKNEEVVLTTGDVNFLTELLTEVRDKWYEIAISLGLPQHEITDCEGKNNKISLFQILGFWIANNSEPTLNKLTDTLCSEIVARTAVAEKITRKFMEAKRMSKRNRKRKNLAKSKSLKSTITPTTPRIISQPLPTEVADGKSTLLQVQASPRESMSYQWKKDDQPLANSSRYSGVDEDILVVRHACQGTEGEFTCQVSLQDKQVSSEPITLTVCFPLAKKHLLNLYSTFSDVSTPKGSWPPVVAKSFINLALIKSSREQNMTGDYSVRGDADDIIAEKENITYKDAFCEFNNGELILVEGRPGSGKTTLVHKIIKDWRLGEVLSKSKLTFLVTLHLLNNRQDESLENFFQEFYSNESELKKMVATILENDGEGVCFVIDSLEEYCSQTCKEKSVIIKLLNKKLLPRSMIIVFSRPSATSLVQNDLVGKHIEVFGFSKEQISEYIDNFPFEIEDSSSDNSSIKANQLKEYLHSHPSIHDMCYLPIHTAMICFLFQLSKKLSPTQTRVYEEFTLSIIYRLIACPESYLPLKSLKDFRGAHAQYFEDLCHLAYEMTIKSKQVMSSQELEDWLGWRGNFSEEAGLGLLTICPTLQKTGIHQNYAFLHLTFQEFLAAYYIANYLDESQQIQLLEGCSRYHMRTVWRFYSGLVNFEHCKAMLYSLLKSGSSGLYELYHYAVESQQKGICDEVIRYKNHELKIYDTMITPTDLLAIEYVVTTSTLCITSLEIYACDTDTITNIFHKLNKAISRQLRHITIAGSCIYFNTFKCNDEANKHICELIMTSINLETLCLCIEHTLSSSALELAHQISHCSKLSQLILSYNGTPECIHTFVSSLNPQVLEWSLSFLKKLGTQYMQALGNGLKCLCARHLNLTVSFSFISEDDLAFLLDSLQHITSLDLNLSHNDITFYGLNSLSRKLKGMVQLQALNLSHNSIGSDSATHLANGIEYCTLLKKLNISFNNIQSEGAVSLAGRLKCLPGLEELNLCDNNIASDGAMALAGGLRCFTELRYFNISRNQIDLEGAKAIITSLKECDNLEILLISGYSLSISTCPIVVKGLVRPGNAAAISELTTAAQHKLKPRTLHLGFEEITVYPQSTSRKVPSYLLNFDCNNRNPSENIPQETQENSKFVESCVIM